MAYTPNISNYKPFYIQTASDSKALDTASEYGMVAKSNPYPLLPEPKDPYNNEWTDEDGDDEYTTKIYYESFTFDVSFYVKAFKTATNTADAVLRSQVLSFFEKVRNGEFMTYDSYTGTGFQKVRYDGYKEDSFKSRDDYARAIFTVTFKVNSPTSRTKMSSGSIAAL